MFNHLIKLTNFYTNLILLFKSKFIKNTTTFDTNIKGQINENYSNQSKSFYTIFNFSFNKNNFLQFVKTYTVNFWTIFFKLVIWQKARVIYVTNNWMYTTNHKRIAVNYFWFVIFAGIVGMVLATIIRLEMAYPGVGILAGDSLQYLSIVTAHAVVMVFFMIMPLMFGAFGNFLLPTQLGVHDVAFPRLNSAAFWFLPAGLIMLCQLVCLDRRYQRMNCFNIREVQSLLKGRFFNDLFNSHDHHEFLNSLTISLRFKTNNLNSIQPNYLLFYHYGLVTNPTTRSQSFFLNLTNELNEYTFLTPQTLFNDTLKLLEKHYFGDIFNFVYSYYILIIETFSTKFVYIYSNIVGQASTTSLYENIISFSFVQLFQLWLKIVNFYDLTESWLYSFSYYRHVIASAVTNVMFGLFDNNIGLHKTRIIMRPAIEHIEIITDKSLFELAFSAFHHLLHRSIFALGRLALFVAKSQLNHFYNSFISWFDLSSYNLFSLSFQTTSLVDIFNLLTEFHLISHYFTFYWTWSFLWITFNEYVYEVLNILFCFTQLITLFNFVELIARLNFFFESSVWTNSFSYTTLLNSESLVSTNSNQSFSSLPITDKVTTSNEEISSNVRYQKFSNPVFRYDFKTGNYFPTTEIEFYPGLMTTASEITGGLRMSSWFFSVRFLELFNESFSNYLDLFSVPSVLSPEIPTAYVSSTYGFFNFFYLLSDSTNFINHRWLALNAMDQKFYRMFTTSSMQQRIYGNWRQLKFTREAWRCRLLAARHQKTLYRRYGAEDSIFWAVERNAKDVLPGWAMITPFSARTRFTAIGKVDIGLMGVFLVLNSSIVSSANFLVTYRYLSTLNNRKMRDARSFFTESVMVASWMMIAANPMLAIGILMLLSDRHWQTSFFDFSGGGDTVLFQHMFWFFGHPEVYVIMIPAFGFNNTILSFYLRKRVSARASLMYSLYTIAFLGFFVWGHHMYMVGLAHTTRMLFSTLTVMISVPAATKLMHWCVTLVNSAFWVELPFLFCLLFIFFFVSGGISGMAVAHTGMDILFHDSFYVIGHFHVMFAGAAMFASFGAFYFYFPSIFGVKFSRIWGYLHITYFLLGQLMTVIPMFWLGYSGMPRRVLDYPAALGGWHAIVSAGHLLSVAGLIAFFIMIFDSLRQGRAATRNSFGISRFNTRFNFYLYEIARNRFVQRKGWHISRYNTPYSLSLNELNYINNEMFETTLYSYVLVNSK